ncbi:MAG: YbfB/YjiJ family MFS transporter [Betaproteobacteria bacterium]|nr:YbfB/YjiJ family MFS transporter [Betaproteobacteria bacterium]
MTKEPGQIPALAVTLTGLAGLATAMGIGRFAFTPLMPLMQERFGMTLAQGGLLASANYAGYLAGALLCFALNPAPRASARIGLCAVALFTGVMGVIDSWLAWMIFRFFAGVASAFVFVGISAYTLSVLAPEQRSSLSGWVYAGVGVGIGLAGLIALASAAAQGSPDSAWLVLGLVTALTAWAVWTPLSLAPVSTPAQSAQVTFVYGVEAWQLIFSYGAIGYGYIIPATFLPAVARSLINDPTVFGWTWPLFGLSAALSTILTTKLFRRTAPRKVWTWSQLVMAIGVAVPAIHMSLWSILVSAVCVGSTIMVLTMGGMREAQRISGTSAPRLMAVMTAAFATGQVLGPLTVSAATMANNATRIPSLIAAAMLLIGMLALLVKAPVKSASTSHERIQA